MTSWVKNLLTYLLCVVLAAVIWFAHAMNSIRSTDIPVRVRYTNAPRDKSLESKVPTTIMVEVRDAGFRLKKYKDNPIEISIDLTHQAYFSDSTMEISSNTIRSEISNAVLGTTKLQNITPDGIRCKLRVPSKE